MSISINVKTLKCSFWNLPHTFHIVLLIEFLERFAFYSLQSIAIAYCISQFAIKEASVTVLFSSFSALLYAFVFIGGVIGDKLLGLRRTYFLGMLFLTVAYSLLSIYSDRSILYFAMGMMLVGNILFKTNSTSYISRCFEANDVRLDLAYTYFYMIINLGGFLGILSVPLVSIIFGGYGFVLYLCVISMFLALGIYFIFRNRLLLSDNQTGKLSQRFLWFKLLAVIIIGLGLAYLFGMLLHDLSLCKIIFYLVAIVVLILYLFIASQFNHYESKGLYIALVMMLQAIVFWILYVQAATLIALFAVHNVKLMLLKQQISNATPQKFAILAVIILAPIVAQLYIGKIKISDSDFSIPAKFSSGIIAIGLCFFILAVGSQFSFSNLFEVSILWIIVAYLLFALGELLIAATGPSMVSQFFPKRYGSIAQGIWYLSTAIGMKIGTQVSIVDLTLQGSYSKLGYLNFYKSLFYQLGAVSIIIGIALMLIMRPLNNAIDLIKQHRT